MPSLLGIPNISLPSEEVPGPWGNSPEFFCDILQNKGHIDDIKKEFKGFMIDIVHMGDTDNLLLLNSFLITLGYRNLCIYHNNRDTLKIGEEVDIITNKLKNPLFWDEFIENIRTQIIERVPHTESEGIRRIVTELIRGYIDISELAYDIDCMDLGRKESSETLKKIYKNQRI